MVAAVIILRQFALRIVRAPELAAPDHQCVIEQPALLEIGDERIARLIHIARLARNSLGQTAVVVPARVIKLDEAHVSLGHPAREQAIRGERPRVFRLGAIQLKNTCRLSETSITSGTLVCIR